ncbi:MAG: class I SAM-dependent methyltransferase [Cytophagales bacterium]|nr:class I SAM-dependent methyltransferase [Rhizobacter sp.]
MELEKLYRHRFEESELPAKRALWRVLCEDFFSQHVGKDDAVVDIGAGYCEFINQIEAGRRVAVDLNPRVREFAAPGVEVLHDSCTELPSIASDSIDVVFMSNFLEHLPSKQMVFDTLAAARRVMRSGGRLIILQPNVRLLPGKYWDFFDHHTPLTEKSLIEATTMLELEPLRVVARFLPYTTKSVLPQWPWLVRLYLRLPPVWWLLGKQSLIVVRKR